MIKFLKLTFICSMFSLASLSQTKKQKQQEVYDKIVKANLQHPKKVLRQALVESANFKSPAAKNKNNILGIMRGRTVRSFDSVEACIKYYKERVQSRYKGGDYYRFITRIGYAEDPHYIKKLKGVEIYVE